MENQREIAEFNDAIGYLTRINLQFYKANMASGNLDIYNWLHALIGLERELSTKMSAEEFKKAEEKRHKCTEKINAALNNRQAQKRGIIQPDTIEALHDFEIFLRKIYKDSGLEMKFQDDASRALR